MSEPEKIGFLQRLLDKFWLLRKAIVTTIAFLSLRVYSIEIGWAELWKGKYSSSQHTNRNFDKVGDLDLLLNESKEVFKAAEARRVTVTDKCKTILTLSSFLLALMGVLLPKNFDFGPLWMRIGFFVSALALLNVVVLLAVFVDVRNEMQIAIDQADISLSSDDLKKASSMLICAVQSNSGMERII